MARTLVFLFHGKEHVVHLKCLASLTAAMALGEGVALAQQNVATFSGAVAADACTVSVNNSGNKDGTVTLAPVLSNNVLLGAHTYAGDFAFTLDLSDCSQTSGTMRAHFYSAEAGAVSNGRLNKADPAGTGEGWQIQLLSSSNQILTVATSSVVQYELSKDPGGALDDAGNASITYKARYYRADASVPLIAGTLAGKATYVLYYN